MTRKTLLSAAQRARFFALPSEAHEFIRHYTLSPDEIELINRKRRPQNRLGFAVQLCVMRYPGRALTGDYICKPLAGSSETSLRPLRLAPQYLEAA